MFGGDSVRPVGWSCRRPGCSREAEVAITYDAVACQVWLDPILSAPGGAQPLCADHARRLSPPRGWVVLDRRDSQASLMTVSPPLVEQAGRRAVTRRRFPRRWGEFDEPRLEFVGPDPGSTLGEQASVEHASVEPVEESPTDVRPQTETSAEARPEEPEVGEPVEPVSPVEIEGADGAKRPPIVSSGQLGALLQPKGRLLSRAFESTGDQRSALTHQPETSVEMDEGALGKPDPADPEDVVESDGEPPQR